MRHGVQLAAIARTRFLESRTLHDSPRPEVKIVLSLGPYGASLSPAQEFGGVYPPPFGPPHTTAAGEQPKLNFTPEEQAQGLENAAVDALAKWHLDRLEVFAQDAKTWDSIDCIAFETVPLNTEVRAIRQAMQTLFAQDVVVKDWWISGVFPAGRAPGASESETGVIAFVQAALGDHSGGDRPTGIGINCTPPQFVSRLVDELQAAARDLCLEGQKPLLVLYPNGGGVYDGVSRTWNESIPAPPAEWARQLGDTARRAHVVGTFGNVLLGGCCKTKPEDIAALKECTETASSQ
jgi:homocysteine S-methyltransferase